MLRQILEEEDNPFLDGKPRFLRIDQSDFESFLLASRDSVKKFSFAVSIKHLHLFLNDLNNSKFSALLSLL